MDKRVLIKLSGESLVEEGSYGVSRAALDKISHELSELRQAGYQVGLVLGGGNFFRGLSGKEQLSLRRVPADQVGMYATLMNGLLLSETLHTSQISHKLFSAIPSPFIESTTFQAMQAAFEKEGLVLFVGGTGHPYFTTDTAAALRATEMGASVLVKATTKVDGIYNKDPRKHSDAIKYDRVSYEKALDEKLQILDLTAFTLCMENKIAIRVYRFGASSFLEVLEGKGNGSLVTR